MGEYFKIVPKRKIHHESMAFFVPSQISSVIKIIFLFIPTRVCNLNPKFGLTRLGFFFGFFGVKALELPTFGLGQIGLGSKTLGVFNSGY